MHQGADITTLLAQTGWMRALARRLVRDEGRADDLAQDAWVAALERPPRTDRPVRAWLATVLRRKSSDLRRDQGERESRERAAARGEAEPSAHDVVERAAVQRALVEAVLELDEPYRTTVLLRFFEELPQREIAQRMQTTTATVNSRLTRALEKLRERLARGGGSGAWLQALVPLLREPAGAPLVTLGVPLMKFAVVGLVAVTIVLGIVLWRPQSSEPITANAGATPALQRESGAGAAGAPEEKLAAGAEAPSRSPAVRAGTPESLGAERASAAPVAPGTRVLRGRVLDAYGNGLAGVELAAGGEPRAPGHDAAVRAESGAGGWFELAAHVAADTIVATDPRYATVLAGLARVRAETVALVVVAPRIELAGTVVDVAGAPVAGVAVELELPEGFGTEWGIALDYSVAQSWSARSDADGRFALAHVPALPSGRLRAALGGYEPWSEPAPLATCVTLAIVLRATEARAGVVRGFVLDASGIAVAGARVAARGETTLTRQDGSFLLDVTAAEVRPPLIALKPGLLPARFDPPCTAQGQPIWPDTIVLRLGAAPDALRGRVVDADGRAVAGAKVWLADPTPFGQMGRYLMATETLVRGDERFWSFELTAQDGTFTIEGLLDRPYRVRALDPVSLVGTERTGVRAADSPLELELPTHDVLARVAGRVVSRGGLPVPGARVRLMTKTLEVELADGRQNDVQEGMERVTGSTGEFEFQGVPRSVSLLVTGDDVLFAGTQLAREADVERIEIKVSVRLHLQVELAPPHDRADGFRVLDASGNELVLHVMSGEGAHFGPRLSIRDGRSAVVALDEGATTLVLLKGETEVGRKTLHLAAGTPNRVTF